MRHHQLRHEESCFHIYSQDLERDVSPTNPVYVLSEPNLNKFYFCFLNEGWVFVCCGYLVPDFLCGVHDVSKERVDCCVGYQNINPPTLVQSLFQTHN